ncbi:diacylglycerol kinase family protein [Thalassobaculum sp. OXR-137]|uniref:diacylglycerol/lipid kinase family protein n=1 Tax=Thalassobaculum sp. OXR-137 TaxID=3100173 RepID=UPI002AC91B55|nr:diacylglycerol kinase family protein [Thalassobaculum sp. OXR-137]WPZ34459.1 diacylglycerol kinase family protein [Thalassobaculum sp. OXR-137]
MPPRTATLIVNPQAGSLLDADITPQDIADKIRDTGIEVELLTGDPSQLADFVEQALNAPAQLVIVAGGDGTVNAAARRMSGTDKTLGILPAGTLNHLSQDLGIPQDIDGAIAVLSDGEEVEIDIGEVNGNSFMCSSVIGFASRLARQREHWRGRLNPLRWARVIAHLFQTMDRDPAIEVTISDPEKRTLRTRHLTVAVGDYVDEPGRLFVRTELDSGYLGLYALRSPSPGKLFKLAAAAMIGRWRTDPELTSERVREASVTSDRKQVRVLNDGEILMLDLPVEYRIRHRALRVVRAREATRAATATPDNDAAGKKDGPERHDTEAA